MLSIFAVQTSVNDKYRSGSSLISWLIPRVSSFLSVVLVQSTLDENLTHYSHIMSRVDTYFFRIIYFNCRGRTCWSCFASFRSRHVFLESGVGRCRPCWDLRNLNMVTAGAMIIHHMFTTTATATPVTSTLRFPLRSSTQSL